MPDVGMDIPFPRVVCGIEVGQSAQQRARVFGQWVKCQPVDRKANGLFILDVSISHGIERRGR
jgi:hypothetical protein